MPQRVGGTVIESHTPDQALALAEVVCGLYQAVFGLAPFDGSEAEFAGQRKYYPELIGRSGFRLVTARAGEEVVAFVYGFLLPAGSRWWQGLADPVDENFAAETGARTFVVIDYGVLPAWRGKGIGRAVMDGLLAGSGAERASLSVQPKAVETLAIYRHWGWRKVSHKDMDPPVPFPVFDILVLESMPTTG